MASPVASLLIDPDSFFNRSIAADLRYSTMTVVMTGIASLLGTLYLFISAYDIISAASSLVLIFWLASLVAVPIGTIFSWGVNALAMYGLSRLLIKESQPFKTILCCVGWGYIPQAFAALMNSALVFYVASTATFPDSIQQLGPFINELSSGPVFTTLSVASIMFTAWSGFIWTVGIKNVQSVTMKRAMFVVAGPVALQIGYTVYTLL